jgi:hypothetical protein
MDWASNTEPLTPGLFSNGVGIKHGKMIRNEDRAKKLEQKR